MSLHISDTEQMVADMDKCAEEIRQGYVTNNRELPSPERIQQQALCAWVYMTIRGVINQEKQQAMARAAQQRAERIAKPTILVPR